MGSSTNDEQLWLLFDNWNLSYMGFICQDVERALVVLQQHCTIVRGPMCPYYKQDLQNIIFACIIMHNMIIVNEGEAVINWFY